MEFDGGNVGMAMVMARTAEAEHVTVAISAFVRKPKSLEVT